MRTVWVILGFVSLILGFIGIFLPVLPTTPFVLLGAFCFSKGSERYHQLLLKNRWFGPLIVNWQQNRVIPLKAKKLATFWILLGMTVVWWNPIRLYAQVLATACMTGALIFIWKQASTPKNDSKFDQIDEIALQKP
jgi:uncharacterized membrane protein YbaN (DUF454 family)